jgi:DNA-binding response OmpR family regulator
MSNPLALIIEDDERLADIFAVALQLAEFQTEIIQDGSAALNRLADVAPMLVILDLHLPHVSGRDIFYKIRNDERLQRTRVILATADPLMAQSLRDEADLVLLKPVNLKQLRDLAQRLRLADTLENSNQ